VKDQVFSDLLWSDPTDQPGKFKSERGIGIKFGPDLTTKFCMQNKLRFIVRSHQLPEDGRGFAKQHEGRCVTIFSASNYCGNAGNYGAVMVLASEHFPKYEIYEHYAAPLEELPRLMGVHYDAGKERSSTDAEAAAMARWQKEVEKMMIAVIEKKPELWSHLVDLSKGNMLPFDEWEEMLQELVEPNLPWKEAARYWCICQEGGDGQEDGEVDMGRFLGRWVVTLDSEEYSSFLNKAVKHVYEAILALDMDLEHTLLLFDVDGDGTVELKELRQVLGMFDLGLTTSQLDRLTGQIFTHCTSVEEDGHKHALHAEKSGGGAKLNVQEFLKHLTVVYKQAKQDLKEEESKESKLAVEALEKIGRLIMKTPQDQLVGDMQKAALKIQSLYRGRTARKEMETAKETGDAMKATKSGACRKTQAPDRPAEDEPEIGMSEKMVTLFAQMDTSGDGILSAEEFVSGIEKIPGMEKITLSNGAKLNDHEQLLRMVSTIDVSGNGTINYLEFLQAFSADAAGKSDLADSLGEDITTVLFRHRHAIRMGCHYLDEEGCGKIRAEEFQAVLQGVNTALSRPERTLTTTQISLLVEAMTQEHAKAARAKGVEDTDRMVDYEFFLRSFIILDVQHDRAVVKKFS
jgi:protein phosphatase